MALWKKSLGWFLLFLIVAALLAAPALAQRTAQPQAAPAAQGQDDWARVQKNGKLVIGTSADYPPFEFYNSNFEMDGFDIALAKELGRRMGVAVEFNDFAFDGLLDALRLGQVDVAMAAISVTPERKQLVSFTNLYYVGEDAALVRTNFSGAVRSATDLAGKRVAAQRGTTYHIWTQENLVDKGVITQEQLATYQDVTAMVRDLRNSKVDVVLMGLLPAQAQAQRFTDLKIAGQNFNKQRLAIAARSGSTLIDQLNMALLATQNDGTFARLAKSYLGVGAEEITPGEEETTPPTPGPTPTPGPAPCVHGMAFVADLNLDDKNMTAPPVMAPGQRFTKKWRVRNVGTCAWEPDFRLAYVSGNRPEAKMGGSAVPVGRRVERGQTIDLAADLQAPQAYGTFQGFWKMQDNKNRFFGEVIWVGIQVPNPNPPPPPPPPPAGINPNLRADSDWITAGQCTTIRWDVDNVRAVYFVEGGNAQGVGGHDSRSVCPAATTTYVLRVVGQDNRSTDFPLTINVSGQPPVVINFWVDNGSINAGQCTTLRWDVQNVQAVFLNEQGVPGQSQQQVCPQNTTTYTLRVVRRDGGQETRQVTVNVANVPEVGPTIASFTVNINQIVAGQCIKLQWSTRNATSVNLVRNGVILLNNWNPNASLDDCPSPAGLYQYDLTAFGNGQVSQRVTVEAIGPR